MAIRLKKKPVLLWTFLVIFFAALLIGQASLVIELVLFDGSRSILHLLATVALMVLLLTGPVIVLLTSKWRAGERGPGESAEGLAQQLTEANSLADAAGLLACYAHQAFPRAGVGVFALNPRSMTYELQATCDSLGRLAIPPDGSWRKMGPPAGQGMEFPLVVQDRQVGLMLVDCAPGEAPSEAALRAANLGALLAALAIEGLVMRAVAAEQSTAMENQRRHIAQDLHDTLAQNIGFLRLKLDQLTTMPVNGAETSLMQELERLHETAEEAYLQVRSTLDELNPVPQEDLHETICQHAHAICRRGGLHLRAHQIGIPFGLSAAARQHILFMSREALANIEKHAAARQVVVQLLWLENELILKITDDGVGFQPAQAPKEGHYGLWIMNYRAHEIGGNIKISAGEEGRGTEVTLWVPRGAAKERAEPFFHGAGAPAVTKPVAPQPAVQKPAVQKPTVETPETAWAGNLTGTVKQVIAPGETTRPGKTARSGAKQVPGQPASRKPEPYPARNIAAKL